MELKQIDGSKNSHYGTSTSGYLMKSYSETQEHDNCGMGENMTFLALSPYSEITADARKR
jgi:hypothetical protein